MNADSSAHSFSAKSASQTLAKSHRGPKPRSQRNRKRTRPDVNEEAMQNLRFEVEHLSGKQWLLHLRPYPYTFESFAKSRWVGRTILDVYTDEFKSYPRSYYKEAIQQGRIQIIHKDCPSPVTVTCDYEIQGSDVLAHTVHRHEPSIMIHNNQSPFISIVGETEDILAVDKPATLPVHPCGGYHQNSLIPLLERTLYNEKDDNKNLFTIHRLDRLTSGLVILAKRSQVARTWTQAILKREACTKLYLARVKGRFPSNLNLPRITTDPPVNGEWMSHVCDGSVQSLRKRFAHSYWITLQSSNTEKCTALSDMSLDEFCVTSNDVESWLAFLSCSDSSSDSTRKMPWLHVACPVRVVNFKDGGCESGTFDHVEDDLYRRNVKPAQTSFAVIRYDAESDSTIVLCRPSTGRTHQIRLHLQATGHPIANDPNYGGEIWYGNPEGKKLCDMAQKELDEAGITALDEPLDSDEAFQNSDASNTLYQTKCLSTKDVPATDVEVEEMARAVPRDEMNESLEEFMKRTCVWCARCRGQSLTKRSRLEFLVRSQGIWLHALQYEIRIEGVATAFRTQVPSWCLFT
ncbi:tRNA pseudouridine synthase 9 [Fistulifera solaris]|uniref:tRNA pseudouridine synthase 9 n=1 Tax=Fistulifera solaris TaxID=1519565 RepID=A0A1Z5KAP1_FISSO|nr:tRNA pseudouridine synthase 9 [Fistulifera solaris]|eukprot:GAX23232.1 tRNA pseudouridine synthase 9 [Fistulifera solaris]